MARPGWTCRRVGISEQTFYAWKRKYAGLGLSELRGLRQLREENAKLKRLVADLSLDRQMLQEIVRKNLYGLRPGVCWHAGRKRSIRAVSAWSRGCCRWREPPYSIGVVVIRRRRCACGCESWGEPSTLRVSATHGVAETGGVADERQTDLSAVDGRRADGVDPTPHEGRGPSLCAATRGDRPEPAVEYGLHERARGGWPLVSDSDRRGPVLAGMLVFGSNSKCNITGPDGLRCCDAKTILTHLSAEDRETLSLGLTHSHSLRTMATVLGRAPSIVSRESAHNTVRGRPYSRLYGAGPGDLQSLSTTAIPQTLGSLAVAVCADASDSGLLARTDCRTSPTRVS